MAIGAVGGVPAADYVPPVGIILTLGVGTSPAERYPGTTWARIKDRFLWGASETHPLGETGRRQRPPHPDRERDARPYPQRHPQ